MLQASSNCLDLLLEIELLLAKASRQMDPSEVFTTFPCPAADVVPNVMFWRTTGALVALARLAAAARSSVAWFAAWFL